MDHRVQIERELTIIYSMMFLTHVSRVVPFASLSQEVTASSMGITLEEAIAFVGIGSTKAQFEGCYGCLVEPHGAHIQYKEASEIVPNDDRIDLMLHITTLGLKSVRLSARYPLYINSISTAWAMICQRER